MRTAAVGLGDIHSVHAETIRRMSGIEIVMAYDPDPTTACALSRAKRVVDFSELLDSDQIDAAIIAVPTRLHATVAQQLLSAGIHVLVEKPLAESLEDFKKVYATAAKHQCNCYSALHDAHGEEIRLFREWFASNSARLGQLIAADVIFRDNYVPAEQLVRRRTSLTGSWLDSGSNALSVILQFVDKLQPRNVSFAFESRNHGKYEDLAADVTYTACSLVNDTSNPVEVRISTSWLSNEKTKRTTLIYERGRVSLDHRKRVVLVDQPGASRRVMRSRARIGRLQAQYRHVFAEFLKAVHSQADNRIFATRVHEALLSVEGAPVVRRYLDG